MRTKELKQEDLEKFAEQFILDLAVPSVLGLKGNMGAGKTSLVKCFIRALGVEEEAFFLECWQENKNQKEEAILI